MNTPSSIDQQDAAPAVEVSRDDVIQQVRAWRPEHGSRDHLTKLMKQYGITVHDAMNNF
ncbi:MAG: hypothetical protein ABL890_04210 [Candidatus Peribacteraceae bacterium]